MKPPNNSNQAPQAALPKREGLWVGVIPGFFRGDGHKRHPTASAGTAKPNLHLSGILWGQEGTGWSQALPEIQGDTQRGSAGREEFNPFSWNNPAPLHGNFVFAGRSFSCGAAQQNSKESPGNLNFSLSVGTATTWCSSGPKKRGFGAELLGSSGKSGAIPEERAAFSLN